MEGCGQPVSKNKISTVYITVHTNWTEGQRTVSGIFNPQQRDLNPKFCIRKVCLSLVFNRLFKIKTFVAMQKQKTK